MQELAKRANSSYFQRVHGGGSPTVSAHPISPIIFMGRARHTYVRKMFDPTYFTCLLNYEIRWANRGLKRTNPHAWVKWTLN